MRLIAIRPLRGEYGFVAPDQEFEARDQIALQLLKSGLVRKAEPPQVLYERKPIRPVETPTARPQSAPEKRIEAPQKRPESSFRDVHLSNEGSPPVATEGDQKLPESDLRAEGALSLGGRGRR